MKKFLLSLLICYSISTPAYAWCEFGGIIDSFTKLHKKCGDYARSLNIDQSSQSDAYCSCRIRIEGYFSLSLTRVVWGGDKKGSII